MPRFWRGFAMDDSPDRTDNDDAEYQHADRKVQADQRGYWRVASDMRHRPADDVLCDKRCEDEPVQNIRGARVAVLRTDDHKFLLSAGHSSFDSTRKLYNYGIYA